MRRSSGSRAPPGGPPTPPAQVPADRPDANPRRQYRTGKVGDPAKRWANREVAPVRFKINDDALSRPALDVIDQVFGGPTAQDVFRRKAGMDMPGLTFDSTLLR
ncbi:hypothetical protein [Nocardia sp. NRRL S-836]|uniref:hypothetical protein n=1 Tax=Nocardia sp. NRRL S-836 TaxID=1519492 RepID=UPI000AFE15D8|nr:hypothetical protein [Nocardia sp. NRRL S-836]